MSYLLENKIQKNDAGKKGAGAHFRPKRKNTECKEDSSEQSDNDQSTEVKKQSTSSFNPHSQEK